MLPDYMINLVYLSSLIFDIYNYDESKKNEEFKFDTFSVNNNNYLAIDDDIFILYPYRNMWIPDIQEDPVNTLSMSFSCTEDTDVIVECYSDKINDYAKSHDIFGITKLICCAGVTYYTFDFNFIKNNPQYAKLLPKHYRNIDNIIVDFEKETGKTLIEKEKYLNILCDIDIQSLPWQDPQYKIQHKKNALNKITIGFKIHNYQNDQSKLQIVLYADVLSKKNIKLFAQTFPIATVDKNIFLNDHKKFIELIENNWNEKSGSIFRRQKQYWDLYYKLLSFECNPKI